jgi:predicted RNA-binding Zn ribbon-like protein
VDDVLEIPNLDPTAGAPGYLELVRAFVNTIDLETCADELRDGDHASAWLTSVGLDAGASGLDDRQAGELRRFREALRDLVDPESGQAEASRQALASALAGSSLTFELDDEGRVELVASGDPLRATIGRLAATVHDAMVDGTWSRVKLCHDHGCRWLFYDRSKNGSRTWCSMEVCGNRNKARSYRGRTKATST